MSEDEAAPEPKQQPGRSQGAPQEKKKREHRTHRQDRVLLLDTRLGRGSKPFSQVSF